MFQIYLVTDCTVKRIGDLPFDFSIGTCGTFIINSLPTIFLCFDWNDSSRKCRSLTRRNDGPLSNIENFVFDAEYEVNKVTIPDSTYPHWLTTIANYLGLPLAMGGSTRINKLEMLNTMASPPVWIEGIGYPYSNT